MKMCFCNLLGEWKSLRWGRAGPSWPLFLVGFHLFFSFSGAVGCRTAGIETKLYNQSGYAIICSTI